MNLKYIYKIIDKNDWHKARISGSYLGSSKDIEDGYIHFSGEEQVLDTLKKYYQNEKNLLLLKVETLNLVHLLWEQASDGNMFPHLYSPLNIKYIVDELEIPLDEKGNHVLPENF